MKALLHKIDVTCALEFTARDVELLQCLTSYSNEQLVESIFGAKKDGHSVSYNGGVSFDQMVEFLNKLKASAAEMKGTINAHGKQGIIR